MDTLSSARRQYAADHLIIGQVDALMMLHYVPGSLGGVHALSPSPVMRVKHKFEETWRGHSLYKGW